MTKSRPLADPFRVGITVMPSDFYVGLEDDLDEIAKAFNTLYVGTGKTKSYQRRYLKPLLDAAERRGLKVVLQRYQDPSEPEDGDTASLESTIRDYGNHPAVIAFKVEDELGKDKQSSDYWLDRLTRVRKIIRKYSNKPIVVDVIPGNLWKSKDPKYIEMHPASTNLAIDRYVNSGVIDWLNVSVGIKVDESLPTIMSRWGDKVKIFLRTSGAIKDSETKPMDWVQHKAQEAIDTARSIRAAGGAGVHFYTWKSNENGMKSIGGVGPLFFRLLKSEFPKLTKE